MLFLARLETSFPVDMDPDVRSDLLLAEKALGQQLQQGGKIAHLWRVVGPKLANLTMFDVESNDELQDILSSLPMRPYMEIDITPIAAHPSTISRG